MGRALPGPCEGVRGVSYSSNGSVRSRVGGLRTTLLPGHGVGTQPILPIPIGCEEIFLVAANADVADIDRVEDLLAKR